jgi:hypothetical protein
MTLQNEDQEPGERAWFAPSNDPKNAATLWAFQRAHLVPVRNRHDTYERPSDIARTALGLGIHGAAPPVLQGPTTPRGRSGVPVLRSCEAVVTSWANAKAWSKECCSVRRLRPIGQHFRRSCRWWKISGRSLCVLGYFPAVHPSSQSDVGHKRPEFALLPPQQGTRLLSKADTPVRDQAVNRHPMSNYLAQN